MAGETGNDVEHFASTSVSVLVGETMERELFVDIALGEVERGEALTVPFSSAGKILVNVPVTVRCDDEFLFKSDAISKDELTVDVPLVDADVDDACNI